MGPLEDVSADGKLERGLAFVLVLTQIKAKKSGLTETNCSMTRA